MFVRRSKVVWSPVEVDWLKQNRKKMPMLQLAGQLAKSVTAVRNKLAELDGKPVKKTAKSKISKIGKRKDCDNLFFRSAWEADVYRFAKYCQQNHLWFQSIGRIISSIEVEPHTFTYTQFGHRHGTIAYTPDLKISGPESYIWVEVKGYMDAQDKTRIRRLKKYYPNEFAVLRAVTGSPNTAASKFFMEMGVPVIYTMNDLKKAYKDLISGWETQ